VMLVGVLVVVTIGIAMSEATSTGRDRQRSSAVATAESAVDTTEEQIQSSAPSELGALCGTLTGTAAVARDDFGVSSTVTYYGTDAVTEVPCSGIETTQVAYAKIKSVATSTALANSGAAKRSVETLLRLVPAYTNDLDKAIFSQGNLTMSNKTVLRSAAGTPSADIYTNGDFYCRNNQEFHGSIYAQGSAYLESQCTVSVDVWAKGQVRITNPSASVGGRVLSSTSSISLDKAALGQQARAAGAVSGDACAIAGKCFPNVAVNAPQLSSFPQLDWDAAAQAQWAAHGYTNVVVFPFGKYTCGNYSGTDTSIGADGIAKRLNGKADGVGVWLYENSYKLPAPTIVINTCTGWNKVVLQGLGLSLNNDLLLVSRPGITFSGNTAITSVAGTATAADPHHFYFIQPASLFGVPTTCYGEGITLDNQVSMDSTVNTLLYSPCAIRKANQAAIVGQVYSGQSVSIDNQLDMTFVPLPIWGGISSKPLIDSYSVEIQYTREAR
jgi:hypothetical protein